MSKTFGIGIMGAGNIPAAYLRLAPLFRDIEIRGVADILPGAAQQRAKEFGVKAMTPDELLKHSEIDVVVNLTVPATHFQVSMDAISAGKHAYSEKPFVLSLEEGTALRSAARERGLTIGSAPDTFLGGAHQQVREQIDSGALGKIAHGTTHVMSPGMESWHPNPGFFFQPGAGPILDLGPYYITDLVHLIGPVRRVTAFATSARSERLVTAPNSPILGQSVKVSTPTTVHGVLEFHSGAIVTIGASWDVVSHGHHNIELYGTEGSVFVPDPNFFGGDITVTDATGKKRQLAPWDHPFGRANEQFDKPIPRANYRTAGLADMVQAIQSGRPARCGLDMALHVIEVMTSLLNAADSGQVLTMTTTCDRPAALKPEDARGLLKG